MRERATERARRRAAPEIMIGGDNEGGGLGELRKRQHELRTLRLYKNRALQVLAKSTHKKSKWKKCAEKIVRTLPDTAPEISALAAEVINGRRFVRVGSGRGPMLPDDPSADKIRELVAAEANALWGRRDITPRMVQTAFAMKLTGEEPFARWMEENPDAF